MFFTHTAVSPHKPPRPLPHPRTHLLPHPPTHPPTMRISAIAQPRGRVGPARPAPGPRRTVLSAVDGRRAPSPTRGGAAIPVPKKVTSPPTPGVGSAPADAVAAVASARARAKASPASQE